MDPLAKWLGWAQSIRKVYLQELHRDVLGDPEALANWLYHFREENFTEANLLEAIRQSDEYHKLHPGSVEPESPPIIPKPPTNGVGFVVGADDASVRPRLDAAGFLPDKGAFHFPFPYQNTGIRLTNEADGEILPVGYAYWNNINNHKDEDYLYVFLGRQGKKPCLLELDKMNLNLRLMPDLPFEGTAEGWYFSKTRPHTLYVTQGPQLLRYDILSGRAETVYDPAWDFGLGKYVWQCHTSWFDNVHSFTIRNQGSWTVHGCAAYVEGNGIKFFPVPENYDECQVDKSGRWLLIKQGEDNRIVDLQTGKEFLLRDKQGAVGHFDSGWGYVVGENDQAEQPGQFDVWNFTEEGPISLGPVYHMVGWAKMTRHVSHCNGKEGAWKMLMSSAHRDLLPRANELVVVDGKRPLEGRVIADTLVDLNKGPYVEDYNKVPKALVPRR